MFLSSFISFPYFYISIWWHLFGLNAASWGKFCIGFGHDHDIKFTRNSSCKFENLLHHHEILFGWFVYMFTNCLLFMTISNYLYVLTSTAFWILKSWEACLTGKKCCFIKSRSINFSCDFQWVWLKHEHKSYLIVKTELLIFEQFEKKKLWTLMVHTNMTTWALTISKIQLQICTFWSIWENHGVMTAVTCKVVVTLPEKNFAILS